jgi:16S rRNA G966 N2-methylase RsmD
MTSTTKCRKTEAKKVFPADIITDSKKYRTADYGRFTIVKETLYSSVKPYHFLQIGKILKRIFRNPKLIVDACAHIGGSTINLAHIFPTTKVISIEIKKTVFDTLKKNISAFGFQKRILPVNENCIPFIKKMTLKTKPDFINLDPPWGGPSYTKVKKLMLTLSNTTGRSVPIYDIINDIFEYNTTMFVTFKAPNNFDMDMFKNKVMGTIRVYPVYNKPPQKQLSNKTSKTKTSTSSKKHSARKTAYCYVLIKKP